MPVFRLFRPEKSTMLCPERITKKRGYRVGYYPHGSLFVFSHSHNGFRYNLPKSSEILKSLLESIVKEHGYD